jgi:hypothetical protein
VIVRSSEVGSSIVTKLSEVYLISLHGHPVTHSVSGQTELNQRKKFK